MLNVGIIGVGNTGNQIAALAKEKLGIPVIAINSSEKDLETLPATVVKKVIKSKDGSSQGAGKDRNRAKLYLKDSVAKLLTDEELDTTIAPLDVCYIVSSTGGGTGSGTVPVIATLMQSKYIDTKFIVVGVLPVENEAYSAQVNTIEYMHELYNNPGLKGITYMLYDNDSKAEIPSYKMMEDINAEVVEDINVLRLFYNYNTKYDSIDENDMRRLESFAGRMVVARVEDIKEKDVDKTCIEQMILEKLKNNSHVQSWGDKKVVATGVITNLSQKLTEKFDNHIPQVREFIGESDHDFNHIYINEDRIMRNSVYLVMSGLTPITDRITRINERIEDIERKQAERESEDALANSDLESLLGHISAKENNNKPTDMNVQSIFESFGI